MTLNPPVKGGPFIALRSMYVAPNNADTAELRVDGKTRPVVGFGQATGRSVGFARSVPSKHNTSAPDVTFSEFED